MSAAPCSCEEAEALKARVAEVEAERDALRVQKDGAYAERDKCVAALAKAANWLNCSVRLGRHETGPWDDDWRNIVFIELPTGQVSWHIHDSELPMFCWVPPASGRFGVYDGHTTPEKYRRLLAWDPGRSRTAVTPGSGGGAP
jgi:hypothetical protein